MLDFSKGMADFKRALRESNVEEVRRLLQSDRLLANEPVVDDAVEFPPLAFAIQWHPGSGRNALELVELVQLLLDHQAAIDAQDHGGRTALHGAVAWDIVGLVELLLQYHADVNVMNNDGKTPIFCVRSVEVARLLIAHGADANGQDNIGNNPLLLATGAETVRLLIEHGADVNRRNKQGYPIWLERICVHCDLETFQVIAENVPYQDLTATWGKDRWSALHFATERFDQVQILEYLLDQGLVVNALSAELKTPLHIAVKYSIDDDGALPLLRLLLQRGADINAEDLDGKTPYASLPLGRYASPTSSYGRRVREVATFLIDHGADV